MGFDLNACREALKDLYTRRNEVSEKPTARDIVKSMEPDVKKLLRSGVSIIAICDALAGANCGISSRTFRVHVGNIKRAIDNMPKRSRKAKKDSTESKGNIPANTGSDSGILPTETTRLQESAARPDAFAIAREYAEKKTEAEEEQIPEGMTKKQWRLAHPVGFNPKPV